MKITTVIFLGLMMLTPITTLADDDSYWDDGYKDPFFENYESPFKKRKNTIFNDSIPKEDRVKTIKPAKTYELQNSLPNSNQKKKRLNTIQSDQLKPR